MALTWIRNTFPDNNRDVGNALLAQIPAGQTLVRTHLTWGFQGFTSNMSDLNAVGQSLTIMGLATLKGNGSETPPNPQTPALLTGAPTQRWIWWEAAAPVIATADYIGGTLWWHDSPRGGPIDSEAQVSASGLGGGQTLDVWATWQSLSTWPTDGFCHLWLAYSLAYQPTT